MWVDKGEKEKKQIRHYSVQHGETVTVRDL